LKLQLESSSISIVGITTYGLILKGFSNDILAPVISGDFLREEIE